MKNIKLKPSVEPIKWEYPSFDRENTKIEFVKKKKIQKQSEKYVTKREELLKRIESTSKDIKPNYITGSYKGNEKIIPIIPAVNNKKMAAH